VRLTGTGPGASGEEPGAVVAQDLAGRRVGFGAYTPVYGPRATLELDVDASYWHRGVPELVLERLCADAARRGISTFLARVAASDVRLLALLRTEFAARETRDGAFVDVELATAVKPP
jgi:GNAT superfamily N-acetyltransferase